MEFLWYFKISRTFFEISRTFFEISRTVLRSHGQFVESVRGQLNVPVCLWTIPTNCPWTVKCTCRSTKTFYKMSSDKQAHWNLCGQLNVYELEVRAQRAKCDMRDQKNNNYDSFLTDSFEIPRTLSRFSRTVFTFHTLQNSLLQRCWKADLSCPTQKKKTKKNRQKK